MAAPASDGLRVRVAALMLLDGKVVLVRHRAGSSTYHLLPGGGVDYRETLETALLREIHEETGLEARIGPPIFVNDTIDPKGSRHLVNITFLAEVTGGAITSTPEDDRIEAVDLIELAKLEELDMRPPLASYIVRALNQDPQSLHCEYLGSLFTAGR